MTSARIRVLVIDDSAVNRRAIAHALESDPGIEVVGRAGDGEAGLQAALQLKPDLITLDLEMPRLDGFGFLRMLRGQSSTPVIVISSYTHRSDVFRALELGAFDFVAKPKPNDESARERFRRDLFERAHAVRFLKRASPLPHPTPPEAIAMGDAPLLVVAIAASTGGPPAIERILEALPSDAPLCVLIAQHMPAGFTDPFARRLDRLVSFSVAEARDGVAAGPGSAFIAPGGRQLSLERGRHGRLVLRVRAPTPDEAHAPSGDLLFESVARAVARDAVGIVLSGMGADGAAGARALQAAGADVWAESEETAVIYGMPGEALATGAVSRMLRVERIGRALVDEVRRRARRSRALK